MIRTRVLNEKTKSERGWHQMGTGLPEADVGLYQEPLRGNGSMIAPFPLVGDWSD
jgi:hypothetical protein